MNPGRGMRRPSWLRHRAASALCVTVLGLALAVVGASADTASASSGNTGTTGNTGNTGSGSGAAVVTPLLKFFEFGNTVGLPLMCSDAGSVVSIFGAQSGTAAATSPVVTELDSECSQLASQGSTFLQQAITESESLELINPYVDPLIGDLSTGLSTAGNQYGSSLAPFGPTVAGLGGTVAFFEGT
jgi:hypothetical protein